MSRPDERSAVYIPPPGLDRAMASLPLVDTAGRAARHIGYLTNYSFHIWYQTVMEVISRRARQYGASVEVHDAELSVARQLEGARDLLTRVDALVLTPAADAGVEPVLALAAERGVPVVVEANPVAGMRTLVAICDYDAGVKLGRWVGANVRPRYGAVLRILDVALPTLRPCLLRSEGFVDGVRSVQPEARVVAQLNGQGSAIVGREEAGRVFRTSHDVDVIFAMDDETGQGAYGAWLDAGGAPDGVTLATFGLAGDHEKDLLASGGALAVCAAMFPEYVGVRCVDAVMSLRAGASAPRRDVTPTIPMTPDLLGRYYPKPDGVWTPDFNAIASIAVESVCARE